LIGNAIYGFYIYRTLINYNNIDTGAGWWDWVKLKMPGFIKIDDAVIGPMIMSVDAHNCLR